MRSFKITTTLAALILVPLLLGASCEPGDNSAQAGSAQSAAEAMDHHDETGESESSHNEAHEQEHETEIETETEHETEDEDELAELSEELIEDLLLLREEEKLARDVYITLHQEWGTQVFLNISKSEQSHTDAVKDLMGKLDIPDPVIDDTVGVFQNEMLAQLYADLVDMGMMSEEDGLLVGATIEDLDIFDIREMKTRTDHEEALEMYASLECGSNNHMRAFTRQLDSRDVEYDVQFIPEADYQTILAGGDSECDDVGH